MNSAKVIAAALPAWARNRATNAAEGGAGGRRDEPMYKPNRMATVARMFKRILVLALGVVLGSLLSFIGLQLIGGRNLLPTRELGRSANYVRDVMRLVNENYVDAKAARYDQL